MHVTAMDVIDLSGQLTELVVSWTGEPPRRDLPVAFNQGNHLRAQQLGRGAWLAGTVELPGAAADPTKVAKAVEQLLGEHDALRARFTVGDHPRQDVFESDQMSVRPRLVGRVWHSFVTSLINERCHAGRVPGLFFGLLGDTLVCAFDHAHADALTIDLVLRRMAELYGDPDAAARPGADFAERCCAEDGAGSILTEHTAERRAELMRVWQDFFTETDGALPTFPIPLGDGRDPQHTTVIRILDADAAETALGSRPFATILAELAASVADAGGPDRLATLIPIHTRGGSGSGWHNTAGWMVSNAPVVVEAGNPDSADAWLRHAAGLSTLPLEQVLAECAPQFASEDIFMVSYLDYRKLGPELPGAQHISAVTSTDTAQLWFSRGHQGLELRVRYPARPAAHTVVGAVLDGLVRRLRPGGAVVDMRVRAS
ncbi:hypothetical protein [Gordonia sp. NPDC003376]